MADHIDYDNLAEAVGIRIQRGDGTVKDVCRVLNTKTDVSLRQTLRRAKALRASAVKEGLYLRALVYDTAISVLNDEIENSI